MPVWTKKRQQHVVRRKDGTFKKWKGGLDKKDLKKKQNNFHGIQIHLGKEYKRQNGAKAKLGDIVRTKNKDGSYHKQAEWYVRTKFGWRKTRTRDKKPTKSQILQIMKISRKGRKA